MEEFDFDHLAEVAKAHRTDNFKFLYNKLLKYNTGFLRGFEELLEANVVKKMYDAYCIKWGGINSDHDGNETMFTHIINEYEEVCAFDLCAMLKLLETLKQEGKIVDFAINTPPNAEGSTRAGIKNGTGLTLHGDGDIDMTMRVAVLLSQPNANPDVRMQLRFVTPSLGAFLYTQGKYEEPTPIEFVKQAKSGITQGWVSSYNLKTNQEFSDTLVRISGTAVSFTLAEAKSKTIELFNKSSIYTDTI